jgi:hypothetical protein
MKCLTHWLNATEGGKPHKGSEKKKFSLHQNDVLYMLLSNHKMTSYICNCWTTKLLLIYANVEQQNDVLYSQLLNNKMTSYICYCWTTKWCAIFATVESKMKSYICNCWTTKLLLIYANVEQQNDVLYLQLLNIKMTSYLLLLNHTVNDNVRTGLRDYKS